MNIFTHFSLLKPHIDIRGLSKEEKNGLLLEQVRKEKIKLGILGYA
jgi:hypothetical protein